MKINKHLSIEKIIKELEYIFDNDLIYINNSKVDYYLFSSIDALKSLLKVIEIEGE